MKAMFATLSPFSLTSPGINTERILPFSHRTQRQSYLEFHLLKIQILHLQKSLKYLPHSYNQVTVCAGHLIATTPEVLLKCESQQEEENCT